MPDCQTISNSSCLIGLEVAGHLDVLRQLYATVDIPEAVVAELGSPLPSWVQVHRVQNQSLVQSLKLELGAGEAEAIGLSLECQPARLILDDKKARRIARQLNLPVTGTLAVVLRAREQGLIPAVRNVIDALLAANFHISRALMQDVLRRAGESPAI